MPPQLSASGKATLLVASLWVLAAALLLGGGYVAAAWPVLFAGTALLGLLLLCFYMSIPVGRALEAPLLQARLSPPQARLLHAAEPLELELELESGAPFALRQLVLRPELGSPLRSLEGDAELRVELPASSTTSYALSVQAAHSGRHFVHGLHLMAWGPFGLFCIRSYLPCECELVCMPRRTPPLAQHREAAPRFNERLGAHEVSQRGFGTDLREIRDHQPGDPFRNIAWKASARLGRLMVREFENEIAVSAYVLLDISTSMRGPAHAGDKLEHGIELCMALASGLSKGTDRFGLLTFDDKVYGHLPPAEGSSQLSRVGQHLLGLHQVVSEESSDYDDDEVVEQLVRYLMLQQRLDFRRLHPRRREAHREQGIEDRINVELLNRWLHRELNQAPTEQLAKLQVGVLKAERNLARRYCQLHGVELPFRSEARYGGKEQGIVAAVETALRHARQPSLLLLLSDLAGVNELRRVARALQLAKSKRHRVVLLAPFTPSYVQPPEADASEASQSARVLHELFGGVERREREQAMRLLSQASIPVVEMRAGDSVELLLRRVAARR